MAHHENLSGALFEAMLLYSLIMPYQSRIVSARKQLHFNGTKKKVDL